MSKYHVRIHEVEDGKQQVTVYDGDKAISPMQLGAVNRAVDKALGVVAALKAMAEPELPINKDEKK